jgi:hypothetical protein
MPPTEQIWYTSRRPVPVDELHLHSDDQVEVTNPWSGPGDPNATAHLAVRAAHQAAKEINRCYAEAGQERPTVEFRRAMREPLILGIMRAYLKVVVPDDEYTDDELRSLLASHRAATGF